MSTVSKLQIVLEATTTAFDRGLRSATHTLQGFARQVGQMHDRMDGFVRRNQQAFDNMQRLGAVAGVGLVAVGAGLKVAVDEAVKFESAMADVKKVIDFDTPQAFKEMNDDIIKLSQSLPMSADGIAKIVANAGQTGIAQNELLRFAETAAKMATAFDITADEAGQALAEMRVAFKMNQAEVETLADKINYLGNTTPNTAKKIMEVVQRIGSLGGIAGVSADQITALAGSVTAVEPEVVATSLKNMMLALTAGEGATKSQKEAMDSLGLSMANVAKNMQSDSMGTFLDVIERIKKLPKELQVATINDIFGSEALPVIAQFVDNTEMLKTNLQAMGDSSKYAGSMLKEFEGMAGTTQAQMQVFSNNIMAVKIALGNALLPTINSVMQALAPFLQKMSEWANANPELVSKIAIATTAILGLGVAIGAIGLVIPAIVSGVGVLVSVFGAIGSLVGMVSSAVSAISAFGAVLAGLGFPVTAVVAGIAALVVAGVALYKNWDDIKAKAVQVFQSLPAPVQQMASNIKSIFDGLASGVKAIYGGLGSFLSKAFDILVPVWTTQFNLAKTVAIGAFDFIKGYIGAWVASTKAILTAGLTVFASVFNANFALIKNAFTTTFNVIKALVRGDMQGVANAIRTGLNNAVAIIRSMVGNIVGAFRNLGSQLMQAGRDAIQGFINGVRQKMGEALATARQMASQVASAVKSALDIRSPSRVMKKLGKHTAKGLAEGIKKDTPKAVKAARKMAEDIKKAVADGVASLKREIALFGDGSPITALKYDIDIGKYKGANTAELEALTAQKYALERNKVAYDEMASIQRELATAGMNALQVLEWEIKNTHKYKDISADVLDKLKEQTAQKVAQLDLQDKLNKSMQANERSQANYASLQKQIALFGNQSKLAEFDYDWANGAFSGVDNMLLLRERSAIGELEKLQTQDKTKTAFTQMQGGLAGELSPLAKLQKELDDRLTIIQDFENAHTGVALQAQQARQQAEQAYLTAKNNLMFDSYQIMFGGVSGLTKSFFGEQSGIYRAMFAMEKGFAIAKAIISLKANIAEASKIGFPQNIPMIAGAVSQGMGIINDIRSIAMPIGQAHDGIMSVPKSGTWNLEKGERVLPKHTAQNLDRTLANLQGKRQSETKVIINNYTGEKTDVQQMPNGDMMVTIGKMMKQVGRAEAQQVVREELSQGGSISRRLK